MRLIYFVTCLISCGFLSGQDFENYTSYFDGNLEDVVADPKGGVCIMGGRSEDDNAMKWFLDRADGGDILVIRASGSDGYQNYLYNALGVPVNSVESIVFKNRDASYDPVILDKIKKAEAIWIAGGNQWNYFQYWRNSPVDSLINDGLKNRNIVVGGTSAGMAVLGGLYFTAENGTITSHEALADPFSEKITYDSSTFIHVDILENTFTETHFDGRDRYGRLVVFLARMQESFGIAPRAIALDEYTAICIDENGKASVYGGFPDKDDNAFFVQLNCENENLNPEMLEIGQPLTWDRDSRALKVYKVKGTADGSRSFDLNSWKKGEGGEWYEWSVTEGVFLEQEAEKLNCRGL